MPRRECGLGSPGARGRRRCRRRVAPEPSCPWGWGRCLPGESRPRRERAGAGVVAGPADSRPSPPRGALPVPPCFYSPRSGSATCATLFCLCPQDGPAPSAVKSMAVTLEQAQRVGYTCLKALLRFAFMVANNLVAIPSYVLYLIVLQPLRILDSKSFWYIEGVLFKWLLAMVASWGWWAGYTGKNVLLI